MEPAAVSVSSTMTAGTIIQSHCQWNESGEMAMVRHKTNSWSTKWTELAPTPANGRISRGNHTLLTSDELPVIDCVAPINEPTKRFQAKVPESSQIGKYGMPSLRITWNTTV